MSRVCNRFDCIIPHDQKQCLVTIFAYASSIMISYFDYTYFRKHSFWFLFQIGFCLVMILFTFLGYMFYTNRKCSSFDTMCIVGSKNWWIVITCSKVINFILLATNNRIRESRSSYQVWLFLLGLSAIDIYIGILNVIYTSRMYELNRFNFSR